MGMAAKRRREIANGAPGTPPITDNSFCHTIQEPEPVGETPDPADDGFPSGYEQLRERRIKENLERMQKLGIFQLSAKLDKSSSAPPVKRPWRRKTHREASRHSSRLENVKLGVTLENVVSLSYKPKVRLPRVRLPKDDLPKANIPKVQLPKAKLSKAKLSKAKFPKKEAKCRGGRSVLRGKGMKAGPEVYTEEDEKLLGSTELSWTLFVDGYGEDRKRIYDPVNGKTCHQCRQKTLGHRTNCCKCQMVQGQFCGDCLYMRYGEHVLEANKNPNWVCPVCRGICNCSLCRNAKGWPPTGTMYKKIAKSGYKSVAHYLVQTKRAPPETESEDKVLKTATPDSAKRSLTFNNVEVPANGKDESHEKATPHSAKRSLTFNSMEVPADGKDESHEKATPHSAKRSLTFNSMEVPADGKDESHEKAINEQKLDCRDKENGEFKDEKGAAESGVNLNQIKEEAVSSSEPIAGSVASEGRLKTTDKTGENEAISSNEKLAQETVSEATDKAVSSSEPNAGFVGSGDASEGGLKTPDKAGENEAISSDKKLAQDKAVSSSEPNASLVASRTRNSCKKAARDTSNNKGCATTLCRKAKRSASPNAIQDSIARRLRPRVNRT